MLQAAIIALGDSTRRERATSSKQLVGAGPQARSACCSGRIRPSWKVYCCHEIAEAWVLAMVFNDADVSNANSDELIFDSNSSP